MLISSVVGNSESPIVGDWTFHSLGLVIAPSFTLIAILISFYLIFMHAINYTKPYEQRHIIRILFMIPVYATSALLAFRFYWHAVYFQVISDCYEAFAIASFFALMCHYIAPSLHEQKLYFRTIEPKGWVWPISTMRKCCGMDKGPWRTPRSGLTWFNVIWLGVYQYCFIRVAMTVTSVVTQYFGRYCESSNSPLFSHIWVLVINATAVTIAMYCLIQFYVQLRVDLAPHSPFMKVLAIKLVIFISFWQIFTISILTSTEIAKPTAKLAYPDLKVGIPSLLLCIEMAIFAFLHLFAFPWKPYKPGADTRDYPMPSSASGGPTKNVHGVKQGGFLGWKAMVDAMNPWDLVKAFARAMRWLFVGRKHREKDPSYNLRSENDMSLDTNTDGYKRPVNLPIADEFRRSRFGMPMGNTGGKLPGDEAAGLISHAQPHPRNRSSGYTPARERYDSEGRDISPTGSHEKSRYVDASPERARGRDYDGNPIGMAVSDPSPYDNHAIQLPYPQQTAADTYLEQKRQDRRQAYEASERSNQPPNPNQF
ncbi:organic solute transporter Ostalpha-domain-containing protein [Amylocarpus encephaloides]|uniref:Organic solute transporter Ostalpha-domain-containing protein n=1 Tax=Amylocarpus encephaloides TaxID=45428 RepID=A0A9P7YCE2_9HELO|nr:organic solute transporter Ostalpha-domain-containing protein [Amylocarpus encephaloides]